MYCLTHIRGALIIIIITLIIQIGGKFTISSDDQAKREKDLIKEAAQMKFENIIGEGNKQKIKFKIFNCFLCFCICIDKLL